MLICCKDKNQNDHHNSQIEAMFSVVYRYDDKYQPDHRIYLVEAEFNLFIDISFHRNRNMGI